MSEKTKCPICNKETKSFVEGVCSSCFNREDKLDIIRKLQTTITENDELLYAYEATRSPIDKEYVNLKKQLIERDEEIKNLKVLLQQSLNMLTMFDLEGQDLKDVNYAKQALAKKVPGKKTERDGGTGKVVTEGGRNDEAAGQMQNTSVIMDKQIKKSFKEKT